MKDTIIKNSSKGLYLQDYVRWCMRIALPRINLKPAVLGLISLVSAVIEIGGFDMASFWGSLLDGNSLPWQNILLVINIIITLLLVYWYYRSERENKTWKTDCQWLFDENDRLQKLVKQFMPKSKPARLELSADIVLEQTTPEEAKRGDIHRRLAKK